MLAFVDQMAWLRRQDFTLSCLGVLHSNEISTDSTLYKISHIPLNIGTPVTTKKLRLTIMESQGEKYILNEVIVGKFHVIQLNSYKYFNSQ